MHDGMFGIMRERPEALTAWPRSLTSPSSIAFARACQSPRAAFNRSGTLAVRRNWFSSRREDD